MPPPLTPGHDERRRKSRRQPIGGGWQLRGSARSGRPRMGRLPSCPMDGGGGSAGGAGDVTACWRGPCAAGVRSYGSGCSHRIWREPMAAMDGGPDPRPAMDGGQAGAGGDRGGQCRSVSGGGPKRRYGATRPAPRTRRRRGGASRALSLHRAGGPRSRGGQACGGGRLRPRAMDGPRGAPPHAGRSHDLGVALDVRSTRQREHTSAVPGLRIRARYEPPQTGAGCRRGTRYRIPPSSDRRARA